MINKKFIYVLIIALALFSSIANSVYAKYYSSSNGYINKVKIAEPIFNISKSLSSSNEEVTKDSNVEYILSISNFNFEKVSDVSLEYYLQFYSDTVDISQFEITLKKDGEDIILNNYTTSEFTLVASLSQSHNFTINISYKGDLSCNILGSVKVKIITTQILP